MPRLPIDHETASQASAAAPSIARLDFRRHRTLPRAWAPPGSAMINSSSSTVEQIKLRLHHQQVFFRLVVFGHGDFFRGYEPVPLVDLDRVSRRASCSAGRSAQSRHVVAVRCSQTSASAEPEPIPQFAPGLPIDRPNRALAQMDSCARAAPDFVAAYVPDKRLALGREGGYAEPAGVSGGMTCEQCKRIERMKPSTALGATLHRHP